MPESEGWRVPRLSPTSRALVSAACAALVAVASYFSHTVMVVVIASLMAVFAWGWPQLVHLPAARLRRLLLMLVAAGAVGSVTLTDDLTALASVAALGIIACFIMELCRRDGRPQLVQSLSASAAGVVVLISGAGWLVLPVDPLGVAIALTTAGALSAGAACSAVHLAPWPQAILTTAGASVVGVVATFTLPEMSFVGIAIGFAAGLLCAALHRVLCTYAAAGRFAGALSAAVLPVIVVGIPVYTLVRYFLV